MKWLAALVAVPALLVVAALCAGLTLPATREGKSSRLIDAPAERLRDILLDAQAQTGWRKDIVSIEKTASGWREHNRRGEAIDFEIVENADGRIRFRFSSSRGYQGVWTGEIEPFGERRSRLSVTEMATTPSPLDRILSRLFFDPAAFAQAYLDELQDFAENSALEVDR